MTDTPAGWYPDPHGQHERRYWDGTNWTEEVGDGTSEAVARVVATPPPPPPRARLASEDIVIAAPMSLAGSAQRIWKLTRGHEGGAQIAMMVLAGTLIVGAWILVLSWYLIFGIFLLPFRLIRRGQRKANREAAQHREQIALLERMQGRP